MIYEPREDSYLLLKEVKKHCHGKVLDMGTGSGILALAAHDKGCDVLAVDVNKEAVDALKEKKVNAKVSDLFSNVKGKFDCIIFNPPYLPYDKDEDEDTRLMTTGGKKGWEIIERFFDDVSGSLKDDGSVLLLFSSLTKKSKVEEIMSNHSFNYKYLSCEKMFMEELYVVLCSKSELLVELESANKLKKIKKFAMGKRGVIYVGVKAGKKIAVKVERKDIDAKGKTSTEVRMLKLLNKHGIGPKLMFSGKDHFGYEFIEGVFIKEFLHKEAMSKIKKVFRAVFDQMRIMDKIGINKEEMGNPYKHVIIGKEIKMVDFERSNYTEKPHNVTQFCQYMLRNEKLLKEKGFKFEKERIMDAARDYKRSMDDKRYKKVLEEIGVI